MGRPLTGSRWEAGGRFHASLPRQRGSAARVEASFSREADREAWLAAGVAALHAGRPLPDPNLFRHSSQLAPHSQVLGEVPTFETLAYGWLEEYYGLLKNADAERERDARTIVENHLLPAFAGPLPADPAVARRRLVDFVRRLAGESEEEDRAEHSRSNGEARMLSVTEAMAWCGRSESTVRRALRAGRLPGARRDPAGRWLIPSRDLVSAGLLPTGERRMAVSRRYATDILWVHAKILDWGRANGWPVPDFARDVSALVPRDEVARRKSGTELRRPLSVAESARIASHLHVPHQLVLWLMRILGLRISEAFGPRVGDVIDLGAFGVVVIHRQGGRAFLTRTRHGVETRYWKPTLKRAASYRIIVVPPSLMTVIRVATAAFHTDPDTGVVDLDARLVPWIRKEDRGQGAFRSALDEALSREGFSIDISGFEVTSHDLRKSLATVLAWNGQLDELAKRRVLGHKAGDDVFARVYTLDYPSLEPLAEVAAAVEADIVAQVDTLLTPTEYRVRWGPGHPLRRRTAYVDGVLAESGWQVEPGDPDNPWCDAARVASELGIAETTARRWMRDQVVPSSTDGDDFGASRRRARLADVHAVRDRIAKRILLRDLAASVNTGYHRAWHAMRRLGIEPGRDDRTDELTLDPDQAAALRAEFERLGALHRRSMRLGDAAGALGVALSSVKRFIKVGDLDEDEETDAAGARYVTRASVDALKPMRAPSSRPLVGVELLRLEEVATLTGLTPQQVSALAQYGLVERRDLERRFHVTVASLRTWAAAYRPDLLALLDDPAD